MQWRLKIAKPQAADGKWSWRLESRSNDAPRGAGEEWGWATHRALPGGDHPTTGRCDSRLEALQLGRAAKSFYELQLQHEGLPSEEVVEL